MAKKISELPSTTTPTDLAVLAIVDDGVTKKSTMRDLVSASVLNVSGWFDVSHNGGVSASIALNTPTQIMVDGANPNQGGFDYLPTGTTEDGVYNKSLSRFLLSEYDVGDLMTVQATGSYTTVAANTVITLTYNFYNDAGTLIFSRGSEIFFKTAGDHPFALVTAAFIGPAILGGYAELEIEFDAGATNSVTMGGFLVKIEK